MVEPEEADPLDGEAPVLAVKLLSVILPDLLTDSPVEGLLRVFVCAVSVV